MGASLRGSCSRNGADGRMKSTEADKEKEPLYMQTFGGFSLTYEGKLITGGVKSRESQFIYLMQLLLHERKQGVSRERLEEVLFGDREIEDIRHAVRSVLYNAKKRLRSFGLPDVNYFTKKDGRYCWTREIPVQEDAGEFERLYQEAEAEEDADARLAHYLDACYRYRGEFFPAHAGVLWVAWEARRYRMLFEECVGKAVNLLREREDFLQMEELGLYAAKISPLSDWETVAMEARMALGRYEEARKLYDDTAELYLREQGVRPSGRMTELLGKLGTQMEHPFEPLEHIQTRLSDGEESGLGGYLCSYPVFQGIYQMLERMTERGGQSVYLMLCVLTDERGRKIQDEQVLEELTGKLGDAVRGSIRRSDILSRYGRGQYLVLLVNTAYEDCGIVEERINRRFTAGQVKIRYYVNSMI